MIERDQSDGDMMVRAAWLYYVAEKTQNEIASVLGVSRVKVARLIADARTSGIVTIDIDHRLSALSELEERIRIKFDLKFCFITPPSDDEENAATGEAVARRGVGMVAAKILRSMLVQDQAKETVIGLAWGRTISAMADAFLPIHKPDVQFVSLLGSLTRSASANPFDVVQKIASKTGGQAKYLPVPFIADSEEDREVFIQQRVVQDIIRTAMRAQACFISVGECGSSSFLSRYGYLSMDDLKVLQELGAVGDTLGLFFDKNGNYIDSQICRRTLAINLSALSQSDIILLSAGTNKVKATHAILKAAFITGLVIDAYSASQLERLL
ncbi:MULTISPECIES: sugar-binding transcriptional regulator [unclassified Mesorhizobium]|uniref:sugar-binding transcriptional regulator n=1 Tax=unclassified Mesorhizobium TaxID=325217 RepID=UPI0016737370|nr:MULTISPECIES: sugar-binding transcriptional regulator [unclassified Mesorhizobium]